MKRLRIFAGPNGSGKSTLFDSFRKKYHPGKFINSDLIEKEIFEKGFIDLKKYGLELNQLDLLNYFQQPVAISLIEKSKEIGHEINIEIKENIIVDRSKDTHSYEASLITSFLRDNLLKNSISFSFESVMSHPSKLEEIKTAKRLGYKIYFYFVCLDAPLINVSRVRNRVAKGGHDVATEKILSRYTKTLENLYPALKLVDQAYLFDNSDEMALIAELKNHEITIKIDEKKFPNWFVEYLINKI
jgi:predicted ABC-type ATPase